VLDPAHQFVLAGEQLDFDSDFEAELEAMGAEGDAPFAPPGDDESYRQLQAALQRLGNGLVDLQLEADETWLEALLLEDDAQPSEPGSLSASSLAFDDFIEFEDEL
jgi:hypothetical protein